MNLHDIVRSGITAVNRDQAFTLYRSLGTFTRDYETMTNTPGFTCTRRMIPRCGLGACGDRWHASETI